MRWSNVWVIFRREVRDQLRDRRTLFMIVVLPILLYPTLGLGVAQLSTAFEQKPRTVVVVGAEHLPRSPALLNAARDGIDASYFETAEEARLLVVRPVRAGEGWDNPDRRRTRLRDGEADAVVVIPPDLGRRLEAVGSARVVVAVDTAHERGQIAWERVRAVLKQWEERIVGERLRRDRRPAEYIDPVRLHQEDVATRDESGGTVWARLFPFLLVMMSLTGAFYPAVDLCAGEKERGTMETLLISPASRAEIVLGKFLTVLLASMATALLNLASMGLTGLQLARQIGATGPAAADVAREAAITPPTLASAVWMVLLLIPLSVFFSALCLALAVLAKSMKEGQYYMMPLYLAAMPLIFLTLAPGVELNLFFSLVPITGVSLLLRALMQGEYRVAARFSLPVLIPTVLYGALALRWAVDQFRSEAVLFREAERFDLRSWVRHLLRDKEPTPTAGEAIFCFAVMLSAAWFVAQAVPMSAAGLVIGPIAFILTPPLAMAVLLTSSPQRTLRLYRPSGRHLALAVALALALNPLVNELRPWVEYLFPAPSAVKARVGEVLAAIPDLPTALLLLAAVPAVCEEVAVRGYILSGLERGRRTRSAIVISALLFGFLHVLLSLFQQFFNATLLGLVLGLLAIRSGSLLPGIAFHFLNNALALAWSAVAADSARGRLAGWIFRDPKGLLFHWPWVALGAVASALLLTTLYRDRRPAPDGAPGPGLGAGRGGNGPTTGAGSGFEA
ncbi:MAG TPA: ABC transporter permease subunit/CPBP intramembrane protease [Isosphaeraceae bacterium]|jgi:sodium transport system permease protein